MRHSRYLFAALFLFGNLAGSADAGYMQEVMADGPSGYWRLEEASGSVGIDLSGNGNDGSYSGVVLGVEGAGCGTSGLAATFDDIDDRLVVPDDTSLHLRTFTIEAWVLWCGANGWQQRILEKSWHGVGFAEFGFSLLETGLLFVELQSSEAGKLTATSVTPVSRNEWVHVAATYNGEKIVLYIDGVVDHTEIAEGGNLDTDTRPLGIGNQAARDRPWNGSLDEVAVYGHALTPERIAAHANACSPPSAPSCPLYAERKIYWTDYGTDKIQRANPDGTGVEDLVVTGLGFPFGIAIEEVGQKMYWTDGDTDKIQRANLDGTDVEDLIAGLETPDGIALDPFAGKMYWSDRGTDKIQRANLDGTGLEDVVVSGLTSVSGVVLDLDNDKLYWADGGTTDRIQRSDLDGTNVETLVTDTFNPSGLLLDLDAGKMYWTETGMVRRANLDGSSIDDLITGLVLPRYIELHGNMLYFTDNGTGKIQRASTDGTGLEDLVTGLGDPYGIAFGPIDQGTSEVGEGEPSTFEALLRPSHPNPFRSFTTIDYELPTDEPVRLVVYDARGRSVRELLQGSPVSAGSHSVIWDGHDDRQEAVASGVYYYTLTTGSLEETRSMIRLR